MSEWLFTADPGAFGLVPGWACLTGWVLVVLLGIMAAFSLPIVRKSGCFEVLSIFFLFVSGITNKPPFFVTLSYPLAAILIVFAIYIILFIPFWIYFFIQIFYWSHLLFVPFWINLILHGPNFWYWFIGPGFLFIFVEKLAQFINRWFRQGRSFIRYYCIL